MLDLIFTFKFVHVLAAAAMFGGWLAAAAFILLADRAANPSVVAVISQFVVELEKFVIAPAIAIMPISGYPLGLAIGLSPLNEFWIDVSLVIYVAIVACWIAAFRTEILIRRLSREAAFDATPLAKDYRQLFRTWAALAVMILVAMVAVFALMIWQPRLD
jgi:uncharacterized membrane protein